MVKTSTLFCADIAPPPPHHHTHTHTHTHTHAQGFSTYKELCGIASDLNQPDLIYKFMAIANHNTMWNSRKGAAFGFSSIAAKAQEELKPHLPALIPKLYRYQFDPSPGVRTSMENIFKTIVPEASKVTDMCVAPHSLPLCSCAHTGRSLAMLCHSLLAHAQVEVWPCSATLYLHTHR
jgi:hypothetical protein